MRTRKMRLVSALLAVAMMFIMMPVGAFAADATEEIVSPSVINNHPVYTSGDYLYILNEDGTATTVQYKATEETIAANGYTVDVPSELDGYKVTSVGTRTFNVDTGNSLGYWNRACAKIQSINIPDTVTSIGACAFNMCTELKSITIPAGVTTIAWWAFCRCSNLESVKFEGNSQLTSIGKECFANDTDLTSIELPEGFTSIDTSAFVNCTGLEEIVLPEGLTSIGEGAFAGCEKLKKVTLPATLERIGNNVFNRIATAPEIYYTGTEEQLKKLISNNSSVQGINWITSDSVKYAHTVVFDNGSTADEQTVVVPYEKTVTIPDAKVKGYRIVGYYADSAYNTKFDFDTEITEDTTVYVKWEKIPDHQLTVTGGTFTVKDETVETKTEGDKLIANVPEGAEVTVTFNKAAYADSNLIFGGWEISGLDDKENYANKEEFTFTMPETGVTIEAMPKTADTDNDSWDAATVITGVAIGAGTAVLTYHIGTELYAEQVLGKDVAVPKTRADVALKAWELAGKPAVELNGEPLSEAAQAEKWAVESGLMQNDAEGNFNGAKKMNKLKALRTLDAAKKLA